MLSLAQIQRRIDRNELRPMRRLHNRLRRSARRTRRSAPLSVMTPPRARRPRGRCGALPWASRTSWNVGFSDRDGLVDLPGLAAASGRGLSRW